MSDEAPQLPIAPRPPGEVARPVPTVAEMLQAVIERGVTAENVEAVGEIVKLYERMQAKAAEKEFARAFVALQREIPQIRATKAVPDKHGGVKYRVAPPEEIDAQLRPLALKHGFTYWFEEGESKEGRICKTLIVQHTGGHKRSNSYSVRIGQGPPGATESQADGSAHSYAKRGALCDGFSIVIDHADDDARMEGGFITPEQVQELRARVQRTGTNEQRFLKFAGAANYEDIASTKFSILSEFLANKERERAGR